ncbi:MULTISPECIES: hypothetical protein [Enterobacteriaceae]|uniref:hypothetical protein n=1 Tax=Enterobacteriaceae TaxID=543 RepID=UPI000272B05C|nr:MULTISPECIES: hypothetical protein [Enterobacteriaceae]EJF31685.1 hypothetical protein A936_08833 [Enterobacter sp. Ag1]NWC63759.1 hypothetical protein [Cedecea sp. P7760]
MEKETLQRNIDRVDALDSVVRQLIKVLTPEQLEKFRFNTKALWHSAEAASTPETSETIQRTKIHAFKISGI